MHIDLIKAKLAQIDAAREVVRKRTGELRTLKKSAEADGLDNLALKEAMLIEEKPVGETIQHQRNVGRYLRIMDVPIGTQWNMFEEKSDEDSLDIFAQGEQAGREGVSADQNPGIPGSTKFERWAEGWEKGQQFLREKIGRGDGAAPTAEP
jgi:hypothetical protein